MGYAHLDAGRRLRCVSPACADCYAALMATRLDATGMEKYRGVAVRAGGKGKRTGKVDFTEADLVKPLTVHRPGCWFLTSVGDVAHEALTEEQVAKMSVSWPWPARLGRSTASRRLHSEQQVGCLRRQMGASEVAEPPWRPTQVPGVDETNRTIADLLASLSFRRLVPRAASSWAHDRVCATV